MQQGRSRASWAGLALAIALCGSTPSWAMTAQVGSVRFDDPHRTLTIETSGNPQLQAKRLINPDRLVIDVLDAQLFGTARQISVVSRKIRGYRIAQYSQAPSIVRIVVELQPGFEPLVSLQQSPGKVAIRLDDPPPSMGERDLETLPPGDFSTAPTPSPQPPVAYATPAPAVYATPVPVWTPPPTPQPVPSLPPPPAPTPAPVVFSTPSPAWPTPAPTAPASWPSPAASAPPAWPSPPPGASLPEAPRVVRKPDPGFGSTVLLRWQQVEALDDYGAATGPVFGYPAGFNGVEVRHWFMPWMGFGLDSRALTYDLAAEGVRQNRTDLMVMPELVGRYPLLGGRVEPEAFLGYMGRHVTVVSEKPGTTYPFAPTQFYHGFTAGAGGRVRLLPNLSLDFDYQFLPAVGGNLFSDFGGSLSYRSIFPLFETRYAIAMNVDVGPGYLSIGYSDEVSKNRSIGFTQTMTGLFAGLGLRY